MRRFFKITFISLLFIIVQNVYSQQIKDTIDIREVFRMAIEEDFPDSRLIVENAIITSCTGEYNNEVDLFEDFLREKYQNTKYFSDGKIIVKNSIIINNIIWDCASLQLNNIYFQVLELKFLNVLGNTNKDKGYLTFVNCDFHTLRFNIHYDCVFSECNFTQLPEYLSAWFNQIWFTNESEFISDEPTDVNTGFRVSNSIFNGRVSFKQKNLAGFIVENCVFNVAKTEVPLDSNFYNRPEIRWDCNISVESNFVRFMSNKVNAENVYNTFSISTRTDDLWFHHNEFEPIVNFSNLNVTQELNIFSNTFQDKVSLESVIYSEHINHIYWDDFAGFKLISSSYDSDENFYHFFGENHLELEEEEPRSFSNLIRSYYVLYNIFRSNGDINSANACYAEMKDVEGRRLRHKYISDGGFDNLFKWQLNRLLKIYTNHGTDPALALLIAFYMVIIFAVFYFFYPSEWDIASKNKLLKDFREFTHKNDKGYFKPFLSMLYGFIVSLINALTLSLNSFVTLGFGTIPTRGLARYVCVLQGFIGWFLLSIFTVALINQVLF